MKIEVKTTQKNPLKQGGNERLNKIDDIVKDENILKPYQQEDWLREMLENEDKLLSEIAEICEVSLSTISRWAARFEIREIRPYSGDKSGPNNPFWKGGRYKDKNSGYVFIHQPDHPAANANGYVLEHRLVMEEKLGRYLKQNEMIAHKNGKKNDNRAQNLILTLVGEPTGQEIKCPYCQERFKLT